MVQKFCFKIYIVLIILFQLCCTSKTIRQSNFHLKEVNDQFVISSDIYRLTINKKNGFAELHNRIGKFYSSFPICAQTKSSKDTNLSISYHWQQKGKEITMIAQSNDIAVQKVIIKPYASDIEFNFGIKSSPADTGIFLFKQYMIGINTDSLENTFSPEPDNYYSDTPAIDIRVDRDQQWAFSPAPLNLSFKSKAGWFSIGMAKLPDATMFAFKENAIFVDYPFNKFPPSKEDYHWLEPIVISFSDSPWDAVGQFREFLIDREYITSDQKSKQEKPGWWIRPFVNTWGEQVVLNMKFDDEGFNSVWVRNYVLNQEKALDSVAFTLVINDKWNKAYSDPNPDRRFKDMRELIDWCHDRGHKVLLSWKAWQIEAKSLAAKLNIGDGEYIDATHPMFEAYIDTCCMTMLGNARNQLNADGLKLDNLFAVRNPVQANYANPSAGMGIKEQYLYLKVLYHYAKKYKPDCLISGTAIDPHFKDVQDIACINTNWDNKLGREKRARIIMQALPEMSIDGDAANMYNKIALYHYVTSGIYGIPSINYLTSFHDGFIPEQTRQMIKSIIKLYLQKPPGKVQFSNYGNWHILDNDKILAESLPQGKGIVVYTSDKEGTLLCIENSNVHVVLNRKVIKSITDGKGNKIKFKHLGEGIYELSDVQQGILYKLSLRKRTNVYE